MAPERVSPHSPLILGGNVYKPVRGSRVDKGKGELRDEGGGNGRGKYEIGLRKQKLTPHLDNSRRLEALHAHKVLPPHLKPLGHHAGLIRHDNDPVRRGHCSSLGDARPNCCAGVGREAAEDWHVCFLSLSWERGARVVPERCGGTRGWGWCEAYMDGRWDGASVTRECGGEGGSRGRLAAGQVETAP